MARKSASLFSRELTLAAVRDSFPKLDPRLQLKNPVVFIVELGFVVLFWFFFLVFLLCFLVFLWFVVLGGSGRVRL
jgi:high-affinity K+ transport system ATPase subunit B